MESCRPTIQRLEGIPDEISVSRKIYPMMSIKLGLEEMVVNIMCAYAPQVGYIENEKETFWEHGSRAECDTGW